MLDDLTELRTFIQIVNAGSLSAAGRKVGLALSVVSKRLASLERKTATRLIARSTRQFALTEEGKLLYERAQQILAEVDEMETVLTHGRVEPSGLLRISAPIALGRAHVSPVCCELIRAHPKLLIDLILTDRLLELVTERIDVVVRIGTLRDSDLMMKKLMDNNRIIVAAPSYLEHHGAPSTPSDLSQHECLNYDNRLSHWHLVHQSGQSIDIKTLSRLHCNSGELAHDWALAGCGLVMKSQIDVAADLAAGRLVHVLPEWRSDPAPVCALFSRSRYLPTRVRLFLDAMGERLGRSGAS